MAGSLNKVVLIGHVGRDPETKTFNNGGKVVSFSLATSETWNKDGQRQERTTWHRISILNEKIGEIAERYLKKGSKVYIEGSLNSRKYNDQSGQEKEIVEVVVGRFKGELLLLDGRADAAGSEDRGTRNSGYGQGPNTGRGNQQRQPVQDFADEIPF